MYLALAFGNTAFFHDAFMYTGVLRVVFIFGFQQVVLTVELIYFIVDLFERDNITLHLFLRNLIQILLVEQPLQFVVQRDKLRVGLVKVATQRLACLAKHVLQLVGNDHFFFRYFSEHEDHILQSRVQQVGGIHVVLDGLFEI